MDTLQDKIFFLGTTFPERLGQIAPETAALFGKMTPQQMVEHMAEYIRLGYGQPVISAQFYTDESLERMQAFLKSEKGFKPNTPNPLMADNPAQTIFADYTTAVADLEKAIDSFFQTFTTTPDLIVHNPFFGPLNYEMTLQLLCKHAQHHLNQFAAG
jgi:hypothetical protein